MLVIPAKAGTQFLILPSGSLKLKGWIPAFAGMTA
jgi:hypothetical protein